MTGTAPDPASQVHRFVLLTDIAHSSRLAEQYPRAYLAALQKHNQLVEETAERRSGLAYKQVGDGYFVLFETAGACLGAAAELGSAFGQLEPLANDAPVRVRMALHAGTLQPSGKEYYGPALNRVSRICQVCNPGQVLVSGALAILVESADGKLRKSVSPDAKDASLGLTLRELGLHPLRDLAEPEQLYQLDSESFGQNEFPPLATLDSRPNNLVRQPNHFIGREKELGELAGMLLDDTHLLSIVAPGGYGKSRLAAQLCANLLHRFANGAFMIYLSPVREDADVPLAVSSALNFQFSGSSEPIDQLCRYLHNKNMLLCLDNLEHLPGSAMLVQRLLEAAPGLKVVCTSREPLQLQQERVVRLEPLPVIAESGEQFSEAQTLFADRAALVRSSFALTPDNSAQVQQICEQLSGIPLAIELAAAWIDGFTLAELSGELSQQLELEARSKDRPERHASLKASLDWSWNLLGEEQQQYLMRLSTFRGGFFSEAAGAVLGNKGLALRSALLRLCDKSWLYTREVDGQTRFFVRDMLAHEYAFQKLQKHELFEPAVRSHAVYFVDLAERESARLDGDGTPDGGAAQAAALRIWRIELQNIDEALDTALQRGEISWLTILARHLQHFQKLTSSFFMMRERYQLLLEAAESLGSMQLRLESLLGLGIAKFWLGEYTEAAEAMEPARKLAVELGDKLGEATSLSALANVHLMRSDFDRSLELLSQALVLYREIGNKYGESNSLSNLAGNYFAKGNYARGTELIRQALNIYREIGNKYGESNALGNLANVHSMQGNYDQSAEMNRQALAIRREFGDRLGEANALCNLANVYLAQGDYSRSAELQSESLATYREIGNKFGESSSLCNLGNVHFCQGDHLRSAQLYGQSLKIRREIGDKRGIVISVACSAAAMSEIARGEELYAAAAAIYGALAGATRINYRFEPDDQQVADNTCARLESAVVSGEISAEQLGAWKAEGEAMSLDELAEFVLAELERIWTDQDGVQSGI